MGAVINYLVGRAIAKNEGVTDNSQSNRIAIIPAYLGLTPLAMLTTVLLARREAEDELAASTAAQNSTGVAVTVTMPVPDVTGSDVTTARKSLEAAGLSIRSINDSNGKAATDGVVISTSPSAGSFVIAGTAIDLTVKAGK